MAIVDQTPTGTESLTPLDSSSRSKRQLIGVLLTAYGAVEGALLGWLFLIGLQGADGTDAVLLPFLSMLSIPCGVAFVGLGLARDRRWAYWAALMLPLAIVPVGAWWIMHPHGRPDRLWAEWLGPLGGGALLALGTVALSAALLFTRHRVSDGY